TGTAIFKRARDLFDAIDIEKEKDQDGRIYFLSSLNNILSKRKVVIFEVDKFIPIRTEGDYREFLYWQDYFNTLSFHPYSIDR
ncbi:MAG: hypothetical protein PF508_20845, partial [Spirochaeta sp.]|nr:hypothetical protein [Spirochaeta sp.]